VVPPDEVVRLLETEIDTTPVPDDEDDEVLDPALAVAWEPAAGLLDASAEHGAIGAAGAVLGSEAAAMASAVTALATSGRTVLLTRENTARLLSGGRRGLMALEATPKRSAEAGSRRYRWASLSVGPRQVRQPRPHSRACARRVRANLPAGARAEASAALADG
jgi:hypothetical protein